MSKKVWKIFATLLPIVSTVPCVVSCSCQGQKTIEKYSESFESKGKIGHCWYRILDSNITNIKAEISDNSYIKLENSTPYKVGNLLQANVIFNNEHENGFKTTFDITFSWTNGSNKTVTQKISNISITYKVENSLEKQCNDYAEQNQMAFIQNLTCTPHDYAEKYCDNFYCESGAEACINWAHHPGYPLWSQKLHDGLGSTAALDNSNEYETTFDYPGVSSFKRKTRLKDYKWLDNALNICTVGKFNGQAVHVYHGYEPDEAADLKAFVDNTIGCDISTADPSIVQANISQLIGKQYIDYSYLATSFDFDFSYSWSRTSTKFKTSIFLDMEVEQDVWGSYLSYSRKQWYGIFISRPENYQLLLNRKAVVKVNNATYEPATISGDCNIIHLYCTVSKQS